MSGSPRTGRAVILSGAKNLSVAGFFAALRMTSFLVLVLALMTCAPSWAAPEYRGITLLYTNDTHGHLLPFSFAEPINPLEGSASMPHRTNIGGIARRATLVHRIEAECRGNVLLLDAGDALDGTPFSIEYIGEADFAAMSAAGYDAMTPGNHEFSASYDEFNRNVNTATFPIVSADIVDRKSGKLALPQYTIFEVDGVRIAVFGLTVPTPGYRAAKEGFDFLDPIQAAKELVPTLREKADVVIALTHLSDSGTVEEEKLAREVPGIDVIVAGHAHLRLATPLFIRTEDRQAFRLGGTIVVEDYWFGGELGRLDLRLRRDGGPFTVMGYDGRLLPVTADIPDDPPTKKVVDRFYKPIARKYDEVIGRASGTFYAPPSKELLGMVCDAMREASSAQLGVYNPGGIRGDLLKGEIKVWDIAVVLPFRNKLVTAEITGRQLKQAIETHKLGVSGIDPKLLDDDAVYSMATVDFLLGGPLKDARPVKTVTDDYRDAVIGYIKAHGAISP